MIKCRKIMFGLGPLVLACGSESQPSEDKEGQPLTCFVGATTHYYSSELIAAGVCAGTTERCDDNLDCNGSLTECEGEQDMGEGVLDAHALCDTDYPGSFVCSVDNMIESFRCAQPPGFAEPLRVLGGGTCGIQWEGDDFFTEGGCGLLEPFACCKS
jgi:hypothetical protein